MWPNARAETCSLGCKNKGVFKQNNVNRFVSDQKFYIHILLCIIRTVGVVSRLWAEIPRNCNEIADQGKEIYLSRFSMGHNQASIQGVRGAHSLAVKWAGRQTYHCRPSSAEGKSAWSCIYAPNAFIACIGTFLYESCSILGY
jgi:hypothetical protein